MFFDIGANIGKWTLANLKNTSTIVAVEAVPNTFLKLENNVKHSINVVCLNLAVCNSEKEFIEFYNCEADTLSTLNKDWLTSEKSRFFNYKYNVIKCKTISLDKLISNSNASGVILYFKYSLG